MKDAGMGRFNWTSLILALAVALPMSGANAQQTGIGQGSGRKHQQYKTDSAKLTTQKADEKAYSAALKSIPNKPYDPWSGAR
jgi:hypothetical protein